ncbi:MAG: dihydrofolate reductase [Bacilli bacterium]|nr:dihydrofolate reductase [Bacilli bacterium]
MSKVISILNCDKNFGIGKKGGLLFRLPKDMKVFRETTSGHTVAMGEATLLSFPNQKPLPNRINIVLSADYSHEYENTIPAHTMEEFKRLIYEAKKAGDVYVIGGASIYRQMLPYVDEVSLNKVDADGEAEVFFENLDAHPDFELVSENEPVEDNGYTTRLCIYRNKKPLSLI